MSETREHEHSEQTTEEVNDASSEAEGVAAQEATGMTPDEAEDIVALARSGDEVPVGAEDFAEALAIVAAQRDEHFEKLQRLGADYQNFQRRARQNERESRELASMGTIQSLIPLLDFFDMALKQNPDTATAAQVIGGVEMIKTEFVRVLGNHGVQALVPGAGDEFDPLRHEAIERTSETNVEIGRVVETRSPGYSMGERVIRPAKVVIAAAPADDAADAGRQIAG
jgi:molecular chaperone GrpE